MSRVWRVRLIVVILVIVGVELTLVSEGMGPRLLLVAGIVAMITAVTWLARDLGAVVAPVEWPSTQPPYSVDTVEWRVGTLRLLLMSTRRSDGANARLHELLTGLVDDRLTTVHGVDRAHDPRSAAAVIGPELQAFVSAEHPVRALVEPRDVARIVSLIENL